MYINSYYQTGGMVTGPSCGATRPGYRATRPGYGATRPGYGATFSVVVQQRVDGLHGLCVVDHLQSKHVRRVRPAVLLVLLIIAL